MSVSKSRPAILWLQVCGLAAVQGAITLTWIIYNIYLVKLLADFGLPETLGRGLLIVENALAIFMEPLMGGLSDRAQRWLGTRFPFIALGVVLSSALFLTIPTVVILGKPIGFGSGVLLAVIVTWALAMTVFRSPALCLLGKYATDTQLPQAASLLTLSGGLVGAVRPLANNLILSWGPAIAFGIGSLTLLGSAAVLRAVNPTSETPATLLENSDPPLQRSLFPLGILFATGMSVAWGLRLLMGEILPRVLRTELSSVSLDLLMGLISIALAIFALPVGAIAVRLGNHKAMLWGLGVVAGFLGLLVTTHNAVVVIACITVLSAALSLVLNGAIPFALSLVPPQKGGLGVGMYFGGFSAAMSLFGAIFAKPAAIPLSDTVLMSAGAFLLAGIWIAASLRSPNQLPMAK